MADKRTQHPPLPPLQPLPSSGRQATAEPKDADQRDELETLKMGFQPDPADAPPPARGLMARFHRWFYRRH